MRESWGMTCSRGHRLDSNIGLHHNKSESNAEKQIPPNSSYTFFGEYSLEYNLIFCERVEICISF